MHANRTTYRLILVLSIVLLIGGVLIERFTVIGIDQCGSKCTSTLDLVAMIVALPWIVGVVGAIAFRPRLRSVTLPLVAYLLIPSALLLVTSNGICPLVCVPMTIPHPSWFWFVLGGGMLHPIGLIGWLASKNK